MLGVCQAFCKRGFQIYHNLLAMMCRGNGQGFLRMQMIRWGGSRLIFSTAIHLGPVVQSMDKSLSVG